MTDMRRELFHNHVPAGRLRDALDILQELGAVRLDVEQTGGRDAVIG